MCYCPYHEETKVGQFLLYCMSSQLNAFANNQILPHKNTSICMGQENPDMVSQNTIHAYVRSAEYGSCRYSLNANNFNFVLQFTSVVLVIYVLLSMNNATYSKSMEAQKVLKKRIGK